MANNRFIIDHEFYCTKCGTKGLPIVRRKGAEREPGHLKKLFCLTCQMETNHVECIPNSKYTHEDFIREFEANNFTEDGLRKIPYSQLKGVINNG
jgi:hypothetical protein